MQMSKAQKSWMTSNRCPSCNKWAWFTREFVDGKEISAWRFRPNPDPSTIAQCPKCGARWPVYDREVLIDVVEEGRERRHAYFDTFSIDNSHGHSPLRRTKTVSEEWEHSLEIGIDSHVAEEVGLKLGNDIATLSAVVTNTLSSSYKISTAERRVYTDELVFDVPAGVRRDVTLDFKRVWQLGHLVLSSADSPSVTIPFQIQVGINMDLAQHDTVQDSH